MKDKPSRPSRPVPPTRQRSSQRAGSRASARQSSQRSRQLLAVGALLLVLAVIGAVVFLSQQGQPNTTAAPGTLPGEESGRSKGLASAPVVVTEWSDFQ